MKKFYMTVGLDSCFHNGNRVAICERSEDNGEPVDSTIAEVWPVETGSDLDVEQGRAMLLGLRAGAAMLAALKDLLGDMPFIQDTATGCECTRCGRQYDEPADAFPTDECDPDCPGMIARAAIALAELPDDPEDAISGMEEG